MRLLRPLTLSLLLISLSTGTGLINAYAIENTVSSPPLKAEASEVPLNVPEKQTENIKTETQSSIDIESLKKQYTRPDKIPYPKNNPFSQAKHDLGKMLYFDPRLSGSQVMSCATCHNPSLSWGDSLGKGIGHAHKQLGRKTPTVLNLAWDELYFWDGRAESLEQQALGPIASEGEMNSPLDSMISHIKEITGYKSFFEAAFPEEKEFITKDTVAKSIATYERSIISGEAPFDKWLKGDEKAISEEAKNGFVLFNTKANCASCHSGWNFSDGSYHDIGLKSDDIGRFKILAMDSMNHAFKTVGLRNIDQRGPYMHDGSIQTLTAVMDHYNNDFIQRPSLSPNIKKLNLNEGEKKDLVAFLHTLTSRDAPVDLPILPR